MYEYLKFLVLGYDLLFMSHHYGLTLKIVFGSFEDDLNVLSMILYSSYDLRSSYLDIYGVLNAKKFHKAYEYKNKYIWVSLYKHLEKSYPYNLISRNISREVE